MSRVIDCEDAHKSICAQVEACNAAVGSSDPDGAQVLCVERAHQMQSEDADRAGMCKDRERAANVLCDGAVEFVRGAVEQLAIAFAAGQNVLEVSAKQRTILIWEFFGGLLKRQSFHQPDAAFAKGARLIDL